MENKLLVEQIKRITEMMGVSGYSSELLKESVVDDIAGFLVKSGVKFADEAAAISKLEDMLDINPGVLSKQDIQDLAKVGDDVAKQNAMYKILQNTNSRLLDQLADMVYNDMKITQKNVDDGILALQDNINNGMSVTTDYASRLAWNNADKMIKMDGATGNLQVMTRKLREKMVEDFYSKLSTLKNMDGTPFKFADEVGGKVDDALDPDALVPTTKKPDFTPETPTSTIDDVLQKYRNNPKKYPAFPEFEVSIKSLGFSEKVQNLILANYPKYFNDTPDQLIQEGMKITKSLNAKNFGWLKKMFVDVGSGKLKVKNVASLIGLVVAISVLVPWGYTSYLASEKLREKANEAIGIPTEEETPTTSTSGVYTNDIKGFGKFAAANNWGTGTWFFNTTTKRGEHQEEPGNDTSWYYYDWDATNNTFIKGDKIQ
jgi:hypothetical protein